MPPSSGAKFSNRCVGNQLKPSATTQTLNMRTQTQEPCRVCGGQSAFAFRQPVLGRDVNYFDCVTCGYFQTEAPTWLEQAYASAINDVDTGIMVRNQLNLQRVVLTLLALGRLRGRVLDQAGGYGILVRLLRDIGVDARWSDKYCQNLLARGFEVTDEAGEFDLLTAFEVFEHLEAPMSDLAGMLQRAPVVLISTDLAPASSTVSRDWWYLGPEHGQHIGFFRARTLTWMATRLGCHHASDGRSLHLFSKLPVPRRWLPMQRLGRLTPLLTRYRLQSRTMDDFEQLRHPH